VTLQGKDQYRLRELFSDDELLPFLVGGAWVSDYIDGVLRIQDGNSEIPTCFTDNTECAPECLGCTQMEIVSPTFYCQRNQGEFWMEPIRGGERIVGFMAHTKNNGDENPIREQAAKLQNLTASRLRERLMRDAISELSQCRTEQDAFAVAGQATALLFGPNVVSHAYESLVAGTINHVWASAPTFSFAKHPPAPSHVGHVIETQKSVYEPDIRNPLHTHLAFHFIGEHDPNRTAFTGFLQLSEGRRGAFQVLARVPNAFPSSERETLNSILQVVAATIHRLSRAGLETLTGSSGEQWRNTVFRALLDESEGVSFHTRKDLYETVAREAQRMTNAYNAAVRLFDESENRLWFVACVGEGWTEETKCEASQLVNRKSAGLDAVESRQNLCDGQ